MPKLVKRLSGCRCPGHLAGTTPAPAARRWWRLRQRLDEPTPSGGGPLGGRRRRRPPAGLRGQWQRLVARGPLVRGATDEPARWVEHGPLEVAARPRPVVRASPCLAAASRSSSWHSLRSETVAKARRAEGRCLARPTVAVPAGQCASRLKVVRGPAQERGPRVAYDTAAAYGSRVAVSANLTIVQVTAGGHGTPRLREAAMPWAAAASLAPARGCLAWRSPPKDNARAARVRQHRRRLRSPRRACRGLDLRAGHR